jgi:hypothetical protein
MVKCSYEGCSDTARFNNKGCKVGKFCSTHRLENMINITKRVCQFNDCILGAIFDVKGGKGTFCALHKTADMTDIYHPYCEEEGCTTRPSYGLKGGKAQFCARHKTEEMVNVSSKTCEHNGCTTVNPVFDFQGGKGRFCSEHKLEGMIDVKHKRCEYKGCNTQPAYDIKGGKGRFCATHKLDGMVDIKNTYCEYISCNIVSPVFNIKGSTKGRFCATHKTPDMVDVKHRCCEFDNCTTRPTYDIKGGKGRFCLLHKLDNMIDIAHKLCEYDGCKIRPTYDIKGGKGRFCVAHKLDNMVDIANKLCMFDNCIVRARYGKPGHMVSHCASHREKGMILKPTAKCSDCKELAIWGKNLTPYHCEIHKQEDEINLVERACISCGLHYILDKDDKCENCNPDAWLSARLAKQTALMNYLDSRNLLGDSTDRIIDGGVCGKERPDRVYDFGDKIVILECDEHQHRDRNCVCEQSRMINISQTFGGVPVYFIRFNPDEYSPLNHRKKVENITKRHKLCGDILLDIKENRTELPKALVSAIYLYYDDWSSLAEEKWEILADYKFVQSTD